MGCLNGCILFVAFLIGSARASYCPSDWIEYGQSCYRLSGHGLYTRNEAKELCKDQEASLLAIETRAEDSFIRSLLSRRSDYFMYWINGYWEYGVWKWDNGRIVGYKNWFRGWHKEPDHIGGQKCLALRREFGFRWSNDYCAEKRKFICERRKRGCTRRRCPSRWSQNGKSCYLLSSNILPRVAAARSCKRRKASLVTIEGRAEDSFIRSLLSRQSDYFMYWMNGNWENGIWRWDNGRIVRYKNWYRSWHREPDHIGRQKCLALRREFGFRWSNDYCAEKRKYICERKRKCIIWRRCPSGWTRNGKSCYLLSSNILPRFAAARTCKNRGASLVAIETGREDSFIRSLLSRHSDYFMYWINGRWVHGVWKWDDGRIVRYKNWFRGWHKEPDHIGRQKCLALRRGLGFRWSNDFCEEQRKFICELRME